MFMMDWKTALATYIIIFLVFISSSLASAKTFTVDFEQTCSQNLSENINLKILD
jgi:hypothetical protein